MKKILCIVLSLVMLLSITAATSYQAYATTNKTKNEAVAWANSQLGKALDYDGAYGAQCVDFIYYYYKFLGKTPQGGNANAYISNKLPSGWTRITVSSGTALKAGDIAVYKVNYSGVTGKYGHVSIVAADSSGSTFTCYQQNSKGRKYVTKDSGIKKDVVKCVIRPDFKNPSPSKLNFSANGGSGSMSGISVTYPNRFTLPACQFTRVGYTFAGWNAYRHSDGKWITNGNGWQTASVISSKGYTKKLYSNKWSGDLNDSWMVSGKSDDTYTFYAVWNVCNHTYTSTVTKAATCGTDGTRKHTCTNCGYSYTSTIYASGNHTYDSGVVTKQPTTTATGVKTYTCTVCGAKKTETIAKLPELKNGWVTENGKKYYYKDDVAVKWRQKIDGKYYYFNSLGVLQTGWIKGGTWMYGDTETGVLKTGWQKIGGKWYWFKTDGTMVTGWQKISGKWYYFNTSGAMVTGWQQINDKWYYFNSSGAMVTGWIKLSGKWYYLNSNGSMVTGSKSIDGKTYRFNSSGVCLNP